MFVASQRGGMDIEAVAHEDPNAIVTAPISVKKGMPSFKLA